VTTDEARQLDVEIHRALGKPVRTCKYGHHWTDEVGLLGANPVPKYSTEEVAVQVVLGAWPGDVQVRRRNGAWECELFLPSKQWSDAGATLAEAVCRARLRAWRDAGL
jgi:hypothetical protein